jgi:Kae1-associated kinase Bud32
MIYVDNNELISDKGNKNSSVKDSDKSRVFFIDFGLGFISVRAEDKAVDLHVLKEALEARHFKHTDKFWSAILKGYKSSKSSAEIIKRLESVEKRGRYKAQY